jgi:putative peptidoglycan binding protein
MPGTRGREAEVDQHHTQMRAVIGTWVPIVLIGLMGFCITACMAPQAKGSAGLQPANDRILVAGDISVAEAHLRDFGFDPGPVDGIFTDQTRSAVRAYQARYGLLVSGQLDRATRRELLPGLGQRGLAR